MPDRLRERRADRITAWLTHRGLVPKMLAALRHYDRHTALGDLTAGVTVGFTNGIAVLIASTQIRDLFGLRIDSVPSDFLPRAETLVAHAGTWSPAATDALQRAREIHERERQT